MKFFLSPVGTGWAGGAGSLARVLAAAGLLLCAVAVSACQPQIGDPCRTSQNCRPGHICDTSVPGGGGYCTIFDCRQGECPSGSVCVRFDDAISACLARCDRNRDCRPSDGYLCRRDVGETPFCYAEVPMTSEPSEASEPSETDADDVMGGGGLTGADAEGGD